MKTELEKCLAGEWYDCHVPVFPELKRKLPTLWTRATFISSVGTVSLSVVQQYIENQKNV